MAKKKIFTKENILFFGMLAMFAWLMWSWRGQIETITPGQELQAECIMDNDCDPDEVCEMGKCIYIYPKEGTCNGRHVILYGRPSFHLDPAMQHMIGMPCSTFSQCTNWPPEAAEGLTECCLNTGLCVVY